MHKRILDHLNSAILLFDQDLNLAYINTSGEVLLADSANQLLGMNARDLFKTSDPALLANLKLSLTMAEPLLDRALSLNRIGQTVTITFSATPIVNDEGQPEVLVELLQVDNH